ncbi:MAG: hypothetical protein PHW74_11770 [Desulfobacca sp.]|nr:hypothetical protein [Desulfobacca sp.]
MSQDNTNLNKLDPEFGTNVFINCPFDEKYYELLRPLLFTIIYLGFNPKIASERTDSGELRINKICELIRSSKYSIHDLSRLQARKKKEFYRLNMAFELGIEYGCRYFASNNLRDKRCLILEKARYQYMKALSDLSGVDIKSHNNDPIKMVRAIRDWFVETVRLRNVDSATMIWYSFNEFTSDFYKQRKSERFSDEDLNMMPPPEYIDFIKGWVQSP